MYLFEGHLIYLLEGGHLIYLFGGRSMCLFQSALCVLSACAVSPGHAEKGGGGRRGGGRGREGDYCFLYLPHDFVGGHCTAPTGLARCRGRDARVLCTFLSVERTCSSRCSGQGGGDAGGGEGTFLNF